MTDREKLVATRIALRKLIQADVPAYAKYDEYAYRLLAESYRAAMESIIREHRDEL